MSKVEVLGRGWSGDEAPIRVSLEIWPDIPKARAAITENGKTRDIEIASSMALSMVLNYLKSLR